MRVVVLGVSVRVMLDDEYEQRRIEQRYTISEAEDQPTAMRSMYEKQEADKECTGLQCFRKMRLDRSAYRDI